MKYRLGLVGEVERKRKEAGCEEENGGSARTRDWGWNLECGTSLGHAELDVLWYSRVGMSCRWMFLGWR